MLFEFDWFNIHLSMIVRHNQCRVQTHTHTHLLNERCLQELRKERLKTKNNKYHKRCERKKTLNHQRQQQRRTMIQSFVLILFDSANQAHFLQESHLTPQRHLMDVLCVR